MGRGQKPLRDTDEGHEQRLRRAAERCRRVLECKLAQDPSAPYLGTRFHVVLEQDLRTGEVRAVGVRHDEVDAEALEVAATRARVFTLRGEALYGPKVADSIARFSTLSKQVEMSHQLARLWSAPPLKRAYVMTAIRGEEVTPVGGIDTGRIADRVLYSQSVHADEASDVLQHVDPDFQQWSLAGMVGDWLALTSHQEALISSVRPDICSEPTPWAGDSQTIFARLAPPRADDSASEAST